MAEIFLNSFIQKILDSPEVEIVHFCPEDKVLGTPRNNMLIHNGDGAVVLDGTAQIIDTDEKDCTDIMMNGAQQMLEFAKLQNPDLIILTEGSDSCCTNIILDPATKNGNKCKFKRGLGLSADLLKQSGLKNTGSYE